MSPVPDSRMASRSRFIGSTFARSSRATSSIEVAGTVADTKWKTRSTPSRTRRSTASSIRLPCTTSIPVALRTASGIDSTERSNRRARAPLRASQLATWPPRKPPAPRTRESPGGAGGGGRR